MEVKLKRKTIELVEIGPNFCLDTLYANEAYDEPFVIETKYGELARVKLTWEQGRGQNYRFVKSGDDWVTDYENIIFPSDVAYIEVR